LIAAINPTGLWVGGLHEEIKKSSGNLFHSQALAAMPLQKGQVVFASCMISHGGNYGSVIFVVDDSLSVYEVVTMALNTAIKNKIARVSVPTFDADIDDLVQLAKAIADFKSSTPSTTIKEIIVVVSNEDDKYILDDELWLV